MSSARYAVSCTLLLGLGLLSACHSLDTKLSPESQIPELAELGQVAKELPNQTYVERSDATEDAPLNVAIHEYGERRKDRVVVLIHGLLSDHHTWKYVIGAFGGEREIWAIDLPGCGESDKPNAKESSDDAYSPTWLARHVMSALQKRLSVRESDLRLTIVGHSLGGGVVQRMLGDPEIRRKYKDVLDRIDGAVLIAPLYFGLPDEDRNEAFVTLAGISDVEAALGTALGKMREAAAEATYGSSVDPNRIPREEFDRLYDNLRKLEWRHAMKYMLLRAIPRDANGKPIQTKVNRLLKDCEQIRQPCLLIWGELDNTLKPYSALPLMHRIPTARTKAFLECMHSVQVEEPRTCAAWIERSIEEDISTWDEFSEVPRSSRLPLTLKQGERKTLKTAQSESVTRLREEPAPTAPSTVSVLPERDVQRSGARYLSDSLRMVPGVEVQRLSSTESGVAFRGFLDTSTAAQGTLGLIDGRQVYNQFLGNVLWDQLALRIEDVERIEIIRGPGSFIHGPNAMHGVVNIRTRSPLAYDLGSTVSTIAHAGTYDSIVVGTTMVNRTTATGTRISAQWDDIGQFDSSRGDTRNKGFAEAAFEVQLDGDENHVIGLTSGFSQQLFDLLLPQVEVIPSTTAPNDAQELFAKADYRIGDPDALAVRAQVSWTGFDADFMPTEYYVPFTLDLDNMDVDVQLTWTGGAHRVTGGVGYRRSVFNTGVADVSNGRHSVDLAWIFAQDEFEVSDALKLTFGVRVDSHSEAGTSISPRAAAVWEFLSDQLLRASAGRGFRNPSLRELWFDMQVTGVTGVPPVTISGNQDLRPESLTSFEIGYFGAWGERNEGDSEQEGHQFEAGVNLFYNLVDDLIAFQSDPADPLVVLPINQTDEEAYGVELEGRYALSDAFSAFANYSYARRRDRETGEDSLVSPVQTVNAGVAYTGRDFWITLWGNYFGSTELDGIAVDGYFLLNGSITYEFDLSYDTSGLAFVRFFNLLDDEHREHPNGDAYGAIITGGLEFAW